MSLRMLACIHVCVHCIYVTDCDLILCVCVYVCVCMYVCVRERGRISARWLCGEHVVALLLNTINSCVMTVPLNACSICFSNVVAMAKRARNSVSRATRTPSAPTTGSFFSGMPNMNGSTCLPTLKNCCSKCTKRHGSRPN